MSITGHKTLVGGTAYDVIGGLTLIDGAKRELDKGVTLVDGTKREILFKKDPVVQTFDQSYGWSFTWNGKYNYNGTSSYDCSGTSTIYLPAGLATDWSNCTSTLYLELAAPYWYYLIQNGRDMSHHSSTSTEWTLTNTQIKNYLAKNGKYAKSGSNWVLYYNSSDHRLTCQYDQATYGPWRGYFKKVKFTWEE